MKKKAITFLEIIIAASVMAIAMIPIFGMLSRQTVETDKNAAEAFAEPDSETLQYEDKRFKEYVAMKIQDDEKQTAVYYEKE